MCGLLGSASCWCAFISVPVTDRRASLHRVPTSVPLNRAAVIRGEGFVHFSVL
jgi:hypothetical protein